MTICIAALCDQGKSVVVASDRMLSAPFLTVEFDHPDAKIESIGSNCVALSAGDALYVTDVLSNSSGMSQQLQNPSVELMTNELKEKFIQVRHRLLDERLFRPRGLSFNDFYRGGLIQATPPDLAMLLDNQVSSFQLGISLIVAGVDSFGGHIFSIEDPGSSQCFDRLGYHAIGSGHRHAILSLVISQQNFQSDLNWSVYNVYFAKRQSEMAPGVGQATDMRIVEASGERKITDEELRSLGDIYTRHNARDLSHIQGSVDSLSFRGNGDGTPRDKT